MEPEAIHFEDPTAAVSNLDVLNVDPPVPQETQDFAPQPTYTQQQAFQPQFSSYQPQAFQTDQRMMKVYLALYEIIQTIMRDPDSIDFLNPINIQQFPQYSHLVQHPMDLSTVRERLISGTYKNIAAFASDTRLIWENTFKFQDITSPMAHKAARMSAKFEQLLLDKLLNPFSIQVVPTVSVPDLTPPAVGGLLARPKKLIGTPLGDFRKLPRHIMTGGKENHKLLPMRHDDYNTNAYLSHMKVIPAKKTFYTQKFLPYAETNPLTRAPSDFNYFYQQYVEYWANQKKEEEAEKQAELGNDFSQVTDQKWEELAKIQSPQKMEEQAQEVAAHMMEQIQESADAMEFSEEPVVPEISEEPFAAEISEEPVAAEMLQEETLEQPLQYSEEPMEIPQQQVAEEMMPEQMEEISEQKETSEFAETSEQPVEIPEETQEEVTVGVPEIPTTQYLSDDE